MFSITTYWHIQKSCFHKHTIVRYRIRRCQRHPFLCPCSTDNGRASFSESVRSERRPRPQCPVWISSPCGDSPLLVRSIGWPLCRGESEPGRVSHLLASCRYHRRFYSGRAVKFWLEYLCERIVPEVIRWEEFHRWLDLQCGVEYSE